MAPNLSELVEGYTSQLLGELGSRLTTLELRRWQPAAESVRPLAAKIATENASLAEDAEATRTIALSSMLLAAYRTLGAVLGDADRARIVLGEALTGPLRQAITSYMRGRFGISQDTPGEAFVRLSENFRSGGERILGKTFRYVDDVRDERRLFVNIEKCLYNEFFRRNGSPEVTPILCALDTVWAHELHRPAYGVRFERPTTLANGDDACRFQFTKSDDQGAT